MTFWFKDNRAWIWKSICSFTIVVFICTTLVVMNNGVKSTTTMSGVVDTILPVKSLGEEDVEYEKRYDDHTQQHYRSTTLQVALGLLWLVALLMWFFKPKLLRWKSLPEGAQVLPETAEKTKPDEKNGDIKVEVDKKSTDKAEGEEVKIEKTFSKIRPPPTLEQVLKYVVVLGAIMYYFYICDYIKVFPMAERTYDRDTFLFLVFMLFLIGCVFTIKPTADVICNRDQTEEWKGWMQVMFVWYHYFAAKEWYNWIRVYIAAYVWMTGFGNFSFFWIKKDYSLWRVLKMLFRLNFLVVMVCMTVNNEYMLYYICAMHTYWFLSVYATMSILPHWNTCRYRMAAKFAVYAIANAIMFDLTDFAYIAFKPFGLLLNLHDGEHHPLHEWIFRLGLDHWACFVGMLCAYNYPHFETFLRGLEDEEIPSTPDASLVDRIKERLTKNQYIKLAIIAVGGVLLYVWYYTVMQYDKFTYNTYHPYTSWLPIIVFIVIRNLYPTLRTHYVHLFAFLGKVTLETYLCQLHIYLQSNAKHLIDYLPGYHLLNFALATLIYLTISHKLFDLTTEFSAFLFPKNMKEVIQKAVGILVLFMGASFIAYFLAPHL